MIIKVRNSELPNQIITCKNMADLEDWLQCRADQRLPTSSLSFFDRQMKDLGVKIRQVVKDTFIVEWHLKSSHNDYLTKCVFVDGLK